MKKLKEKKLPKKLPKFLHKYFWDIDPKEINPSTSSIYMINRILDRGNLKALNWVLNNFPLRLIKKTIKTQCDWQKKSINFWSIYFNLKRDQIKCLNKSYLSKRKTFWPY